ncbi:MAG: hypothetical protein U0R71_12630 [Solirubrobacterales bacterium]
MAPWKLPLLVAAIVVPTVAAFWLGGPGAGVTVGALAAVAIVVVAVRARPRGAIGEPPTPASERRLLVVVTRPLEDPKAIAAIAAEAGPREAEPAAEVLVLSPVRIGFLDRWASDVEGARRQAQRNLVISVASLAAAGVAAEARVGDEDLVQAVEDTVQGYAATGVVLITADDEEDPAAADAAAELASRLRARFRRITVSDQAAR